MASSSFPSQVTGVTVETATSGALSGDGSSGNKLAVGVDNTTVEVNGSNQLQVKGSGVPLVAFKTIAVAGQSDLVADAPADTLTIVAGSNITLTTNAGTDTLTIAASGGGGGGAPFTVADGDDLLRNSDEESLIGVDGNGNPVVQGFDAGDPGGSFKFFAGTPRIVGVHEIGVSLAEQGDDFAFQMVGPAANVGAYFYPKGNGDFEFQGPVIVQVAGIAASYTTAFADPNANLTFTASNVGQGGNGLAIEYLDPAGNDEPLTYTAVGSTLQISLATGPTGTITTLAQDIIDNFDADGLAITTPTNIGDGSGVVEAFAAQNLAGGLGALNVTGPLVMAAGTGNVIILPTVDPEVVGALWNNSGTITISAG